MAIFGVASSLQDLRQRSGSCPPIEALLRSLGFSPPRWLLLAILLAAPASSVYSQDSGPDGGQRLFDSFCSACHQYDDQGMGEAPPLEGAPWVAGPAERLIRIILHGVSGRIEMDGKVYDREMPGFGKVLSDGQTASLATYVRKRFAQVTIPVTPAEVRRIRQEHAQRSAYWPADELLEIR